MVLHPGNVPPASAGAKITVETRPQFRPPLSSLRKGKQQSSHHLTPAPVYTDDGPTDPELSTFITITPSLRDVYRGFHPAIVPSSVAKIKSAGLVCERAQVRCPVEDHSCRRAGDFRPPDGEGMLTTTDDQCARRNAPEAS